MKVMNVLITGATGFIGKHLVNFLLSEHMEVHCVVRDARKIRKTHRTSNLLHCIEGDLLTASTIQKLPKSVDAVIHLVALLGDWGVDQQAIKKTNLEMTENILHWFSCSDSGHFIFFSTPGVQGFGHKLATETAPYNPRGIYEISKVLGEKKVQQYSLSPSQNWTILRPDFVYGPEDYRRIRLYSRIKRRRWINVGNCNSALRPTHVRDVCRAVLLCLGNPKAYSQIFNVAGPELVSVFAYLATIAKILEVKLFPFSIPTFISISVALVFEWFARVTHTKPIVTRSQVEFLTHDHGTDISKIQNTLRFTPSIHLDNGMRETLTWATNHKLL